MTPEGKNSAEAEVRKIFTIGHVALPAERFVQLLQQHGIRLVVDIRRFPGSRTSPQFNPQELRLTLAHAGIGYAHLEALGGRRRARPDSLNTVWNNESFRGYADYMETAEFRDGLEELMARASAEPVAIMCAEAVWWRCHRSMVSDALTAKGWQVCHIMSDGSVRPHRYTAPAGLIDGELTYHREDPE
jgi:uncharacterized protein (DUF488 family)